MDGEVVSVTPSKFLKSFFCRPEGSGVGVGGSVGRWGVVGGPRAMSPGGLAGLGLDGSLRVWGRFWFGYTSVLPLGGYQFSQLAWGAIRISTDDTLSGISGISGMRGLPTCAPEKLKNDAISSRMMPLA